MSKLFKSPSANQNGETGVLARPISPASSAPASALRVPEFSPEQRRTLLGIAHAAILTVVESRTFVDAPPTLPGLAEPRGVFTTLYLPSDLPSYLPSDSQGDLTSEFHRDPHGELRGCVGYALPVVPLYRAVAETARAAAFDDSRFLPVTIEEVPQLEVSLSVLSRLFPIHPAEVEVGRHGLFISQGSCRGLLLPQVPVEQNWNRETFLEQTCRKAGLPLDAWRKDATTLEAFTAEVFSDSDVRSRES